ncbi:hypothetical protein TNCV_1775331 [Trichonephila clavipes]|nr:hypothetical protein TNCV_1775331 [Trichonephila clavipes]
MLIPVSEDQALSMKCVYERFAHFREGRESVSDNPRSGRLAISVSDENIEKERKRLFLHAANFDEKECSQLLGVRGADVMNVIYRVSFEQDKKFLSSLLPLDNPEDISSVQILKRHLQNVVKNLK